MKYKIQWQDRWGNWQHYQTKTNEADAFRVMKQMVKQKGIRHRIVDSHEMGHFLGDIPALFILAFLAGYTLRKEQFKE